MARRPTPKPSTPIKVPPPASWLRGAGLVACAAVLLADVLWDHQLNESPWAYLASALVLVWGPDLLLALPDILRALFKRGA